MNHLNDDDIAAFLISNQEVREDLACEQCAIEMDLFRKQLQSAQSELATAAQRDESFWTRQRAAIRRRISPSRTDVGLKWATSLAVLLLVAALLLSSGANPSLDTVQTAQPDPDYVLLAGIQQTLARPLPNAVEPVRVLAGDMDQAWRAHIRQVQAKQRSTGR